MSDQFRAYRQSLANQVAKELRQAALDSDDWGHPLREAAFSSWLLRHPFTAQQVEMDVIHIGMRGEGR